jgi:transcriptional regulator
MYTPPPFKPDRAASLAFAQARGFGLFCASDAARPIASSLPFALRSLADGTPEIAFHVARGNPLARLADGRTSWLLAITGADAYVSADWYVSPEQVPTWLYQAVHLTGVVRPITEAELGAEIDQLSDTFERWLAPKPVWTSAKVTASRMAMLKTAIVGLVMTVEDVEGSFKLNQHKSDADHTAVTDALAQRPDPGSQEVARMMRAQRPHLDYKTSTPVSVSAD